MSVKYTEDIERHWIDVETWYNKDYQRYKIVRYANWIEYLYNEMLFTEEI